MENGIKVETKEVTVTQKVITIDNTPQYKGNGNSPADEMFTQATNHAIRLHKIKKIIKDVFDFELSFKQAIELDRRMMSGDDAKTALIAMAEEGY